MSESALDFSNILSPLPPEQAPVCEALQAALGAVVSHLQALERCKDLDSLSETSPTWDALEELAVAVRSVWVAMETMGKEALDSLNLWRFKIDSREVRFASELLMIGWHEKKSADEEVVVQAGQGRPLRPVHRIHGLLSENCGVGWLRLRGIRLALSEYKDALLKAIRPPGADSGEAEAARKTLRLRVEGNQIFLDDLPVPDDLTSERREQALCFIRYLLEAAGNWFSGGDIDRAERKREGKQRGVRAAQHEMGQGEEAPPSLYLQPD